jgi:rare lipoprotein A
MRRLTLLGTLFVSVIGPVLTLTAQPVSTAYASQPHIWRLEGVASWYSSTDPGVRLLTANQEPFDETAMTCAMWGVPFDTMLRVTNLTNGRFIVVRVNDRGPAERLVLSENRIIDLSKGAFGQIARHKQGLIRVRVELE